MTSGLKHQKILSLGVGYMISSSPHRRPTKNLGETFCSLDNGAFPAFAKGYPFQADIFRETIKQCYKHNIKLDFIVCPDIVRGGLASLEFSMRWAKGELLGTPNLALVVQDGMTSKDITAGCHLKLFTHIFIGGSVEWKWKTAEMRTKFARDNGKKIHIGQCGQLKYLEYARELKVDSVDSASIVINNSFGIIEQFLGNEKNLFSEAS
jgi:hypothetical protein